MKLANDEGQTDDSGGDDVELHGSKPPVKLANDEGANDDSGDDDVELHKKSHRL